MLGYAQTFHIGGSAIEAVAVTAIAAATVIICIFKAIAVYDKHVLSKYHLDTFKELSDALQIQIKADAEKTNQANQEKVNQLSSRFDALLMNIKMHE